MIGNDIIDLCAAAEESNWKRKGWLDKVFTATERDRVLSDKKPEILVWLFWSMKESAYKIWNRMFGLRIYQPQRFCCHIRHYYGREVAGTVVTGMLEVSTQTIIRESFLHTIACLPNNCGQINVYTGKRCSPGAKRPSYQKDDYGLPFMPGIACGSSHPASVSHHGQFEAIVY